MTLSVEYWDRQDGDVFGRVRTGWTDRDFDTRRDDSIANQIEFNSDDVVMDFGCGPGYACKLVAPKVKTYVGVDYSEAMLDLARSRNSPDAQFVLSGNRIPFQDNWFDCVFSELVFQHNQRNVTIHLLDEIKRVLKTNGRAALQLPGMFYGREIGFTADELARLLSGWRFSEDEYYIYCFFNL